MPLQLFQAGALLLLPELERTESLTELPPDTVTTGAETITGGFSTRSATCSCSAFHGQAELIAIWYLVRSCTRAEAIKNSDTDLPALAIASSWSQGDRLSNEVGVEVAGVEVAGVEAETEMVAAGLAGVSTGCEDRLAASLMSCRNAPYHWLTAFALIVKPTPADNPITIKAVPVILFIEDLDTVEPD